MESKPTTDNEALTLALVLAATAPTERQSSECLAIAQGLAEKMSEVEVVRAQERADRLLLV